MTSAGASRDAGRRTYAASHVGLVRERNEDSCAVFGADERLTNWRGSLSSQNGWALIADGVGGHVAGETASALAIEILRPMMSAIRTEHEIHQAVNVADTALFLAMDMQPELRGMGTTIAGVLLRPGEVIAFNAGDSRIYSFVDGKLRQLSIDDATKGGALLQCLGGFQEPIPIFVHTRRVDPDAVLVICSDGLTNLLNVSAIERILKQHPADPAAVLVNVALEAGGLDNVTVVVIDNANPKPKLPSFGTGSADSGFKSR